MSESLRFEYLADEDVMVIEGTRYSGELLRSWGNGKTQMPVGTLFRITSREDGTIGIEKTEGSHV